MWLIEILLLYHKSLNNKIPPSQWRYFRSITLVKFELIKLYYLIPNSSRVYSFSSSIKSKSIKPFFNSKLFASESNDPLI